MLTKHDQTKALLAESFKTLLLDTPFEKITVNMMVDRAEIRRSSFYNYFMDKYDLLEWCGITEIMQKCDMLLSEGMTEEAVKILFSNVIAQLRFYRIAFTVTGQNDFEAAFVEALFLRLARYFRLNSIGGVSGEQLMHFYAGCFVSSIRMYIESAPAPCVEEMMAAFHFIISHAPRDLFSIAT